MVVLSFLSKVLVDGWDLCMVLCHSMNAGWVVGTLKGGENVQILLL